MVMAMGWSMYSPEKYSRAFLSLCSALLSLSSRSFVASLHEGCSFRHLRSSLIEAFSAFDSQAVRAYQNRTKNVISNIDVIYIAIKGIDQFWSCDCIVKEKLWNRSEKVDHLAYRY